MHLCSYIVVGLISQRVQYIRTGYFLNVDYIKVVAPNVFRHHPHPHFCRDTINV